MSEGQGIRLSITECLRAVEERLGRAAAIAKAGLACAESGHEQEALQIVTTSNSSRERPTPCSAPPP